MKKNKTALIIKALRKATPGDPLTILAVKNLTGLSLSAVYVRINILKELGLLMVQAPKRKQDRRRGKYRFCLVWDFDSRYKEFKGDEKG